MFLRNKTTGEQGELIGGTGLAFIIRVYAVRSGETPYVDYQYESLADLNKEWEDEEEAKKYWWLSACGLVYPDTERGDSFYEGCEKMGNVFASKKEAEKAKKKLEALKRLKDAGFRIDFWKYDADSSKCLGTGEAFFSVGKGEGVARDLELLFSEEQ